MQTDTELADAVAKADELLGFLRSWSDSEFANAASGEFCEDLKGRIEGSLSNLLDRLRSRDGAVGDGHLTDHEREVLASGYIRLSGKNTHASDCATSCAPAMIPGPCDCDAVDQPSAAGCDLAGEWQRLALNAVECLEHAEKETEWGKYTFGPSISESLRGEADRLASLASRPSGAGEAIPVAGMLHWIKTCWPVGSGSDFNQGVVRGFEIIQAQLEHGHIQRYCAALSTPQKERGE